MTLMDERGPRWPAASALTPLLRVGANGATDEMRPLVNEVPIALVFNGTTVAVMMASPMHVDDFARGFALTEGYITGLGDIEAFDIVRHDSGIEARFWVADAQADALTARRRAMLGPIGCGLCGIESLDQALRPAARVGEGIRLCAADLPAAFGELRRHQSLHDETRSCHAAGFFVPGESMRLCREDVGRHNALDKLIGARLAEGQDGAGGVILMTSRLSVELIQKASAFGCSVLAGVSGPSALAVSAAAQANLTLVGFCNAGAFDVFTCPERIVLE
ncbi:MAG: formate dehydrogenase accessory sulfurtransferase FdhD [Pseudomonadota bacterium]